MKKLILPIFAIALMLVLSSCDRLENGDLIILSPESTSAGTTKSALTESETSPPPSQGTETSIIPPAIEEKDVKISFLACGDNMIHTNVYSDAITRAESTDKKYNFTSMYDDVADIIKDAGIAFINHECPIGGEELGISGWPNFNSPKESGEALVELGFDIINIANNHMLDKKEIGLANTIKFWETQDVLMLGGYTKEDFDSIRVYTEQGVKIAFLSYTYEYPTGTNNMFLPAGSNYVIPYINDNDLLRQIKLAKGAGDLVFVSMHWGIEESFTTSKEQKRLSKLMADNGVDVIIGHHPHVVQPIEWIEGKDGHNTLCIYSLGNVISTQMYGRNMVGVFVSFDIAGNLNDGLKIENVLATPTMTHYNMNRRGLQVYKFENYTRELASLHGCIVDDPSFTYDKAVKFITDTIDSKFLPSFY